MAFDARLLPTKSTHTPFTLAEALKKNRSVSMGESSVEVHSCEDSRTSTQQKLCSEAPDLFSCSICLELVYKPIVQACGHIFCFWCAYQAMNVRRESQCPVCRRPYQFFPRVCELLHFALTKAVPEEYERRGREVQSTEEQKQVFSPRFLESPRHLWSPQNLEEGIAHNWQIISLPTTPRTMVASDAQGDNSKRFSTPDYSPSVESDTTQRDTDCLRRDAGAVQSILTADDFACSFCNQLVYRPVVLNCGEVFCESCLKEAAFKVFRCPCCRASHPSGRVFICLELHQYLESAFPTEYLKRKLQQPAERTESSDCKNAGGGFRTDGGCRTDGGFHVGVGCDGCGMFPIGGDRYRCKDCTEKIGFDLCGSCFITGASLPGRFNQVHRSNHRMECMKSPVSNFLVLNMRNGSIQQRRQQQQPDTDLDDYIDSFVD